MKPLSSDEMRGSWATLLLPVNGDETIDYARLAEEIDRLITFRVDGIYSNGTAGEFYTQTEDEFDRVNSLLAERCERAGTAFQIGVSHASPQISLERLRRAVHLKPAALQIIFPDWLPVTDGEAVAFLDRMAEAADPVGLVLYNPPHAKRVIEPVTFAYLKKKVPRLIGVKVMDGDEIWYAGMREHAGGLSVFVPGHHLATGVRERVASGSYSNVACLQPAGAQRWYENTLLDLDGGLRTEAKIQKFMKLFIAPYKTREKYSAAALDKLLAAAGGWTDAGTRLRWPYRWVPESEAQALRPVVRKMIPELFPAD